MLVFNYFPRQDDKVHCHNFFACVNQHVAPFIATPQFAALSSIYSLTNQCYSPLLSDNATTITISNSECTITGKQVVVIFCTKQVNSNPHSLLSCCNKRVQT